MRLAVGDSEEFSLNLTSMSDIVFLMLVFFMLATTFVDPERSLEVELPPASSGAEAPTEELVINVLEDGSLVVSGEALTQGALRSRLESVGRAAPETPVTIRGHRQARHEAIVAVMDACGLAGLHNLSIGTSKREQG